MKSHERRYIYALPPINFKIGLEEIESQIFNHNKVASTRLPHIQDRKTANSSNIKMKLNQAPSYPYRCCSSLTEVQKFGRLLPLHDVRFQGRFLQSLGSTEVSHVSECYVLLDLSMSDPKAKPIFSRFQYPTQIIRCGENDSNNNKITVAIEGVHTDSVLSLSPMAFLGSRA